MGHLSKRIEQYGYNVTSYDLIDRGYCEVKDFFDIKSWEGSICTNPPYKQALECVWHALDIVNEGQDVVMFLKLQFLEGQKRRELFNTKQLRTIYVFSKRILCAKNGEFDKKTDGSAVAYAWYIWTKGYNGQPEVKWIS